MTFEEARAQYPVLARYAYLNAGSSGPVARATNDALTAAHAEELEHGRAGRAYFESVIAARERLRELFARELGVSSDNIALASSTTEGCNIAVAGLDLGPEDEIVTTDSEHFGLLGPVAASGARVRVAGVRDRPASEALDAILAETGRRTRLLALSHVAWTTGHVLPVAELKEALPDVPMLVDGAQTVGAVPVDVAPFDFYTVSAQKWLCGPSPAGALYVRDPEALRVAAPAYFGQDGYELDGSFTPQPGARRFDPIWISPAYIAALEAALSAHPPWRYERAREAATRCRELLAERFDVVTEPGHATLVSFRAPGDPKDIAAQAERQDVIVRDLPGTGWVRVSCGYWTSDDDLERLLAALS